MNNINVFDEASRSGNVSNIEKSSAHMYCHLMKINFHKRIASSWLGTVFNQWKELTCIKNKSFWNDIISNNEKLNRIRINAITEYEKDGNKYGDVQFNIIHNEFPDIRMFKDKDLLINFMIKFAKDDKEANYIASKFNSGRC